MRGWDESVRAFAGRVPALVGLLTAVISAAALMVGEPWGLNGLRELMQRSAQEAIARGVRVGEFNEWVDGVTFLALERAPDGALRNVMFSDRRDPKRPVVISARGGSVEQGKNASDIVFNLQDGVIIVRDEGDSDDRVIRFEHSLYRLSVQALVRRKSRSISHQQGKKMSELWYDSGDLSLDRSSRAFATVVLHRKIAIPLAGLIFALLAVPLACNRDPGARARGFLLSSCLVGAYYYIGRAAELSARGGTFHPTLAAWVPDILGALGLVVMLWRFRRSAI